MADALKESKVYVTLTRLERAGLVSSERKVCALTAAGWQRGVDWLEACAPLL
ncbi:hypothetical protein SAMN04489716_1959 [Actinoplanes derwentensis]|uniref:Transcriptional regulator PadR-like family protein n=1 Tax=Actinoplanes derwentensis TaxID=113562 RepID=A0A1H1W1X3_9ACTN|nr:hypothetical protein Ade03nite_29480 [Actinoplanes derwentensis]SDS91117.1 hypothetical protein SAMN04489716_1959 [Actinoplanes derwentensis]